MGRFQMPIGYYEFFLAAYYFCADCAVRGSGEQVHIAEILFIE
jgi:hypothetical protein